MFHNFINPVRNPNSSIYAPQIPQSNIQPRRSFQRVAVPQRCPSAVFPKPQMTSSHQAHHQQATFSNKQATLPFISGSNNLHNNNGTKSRMKQLQHDREKLSRMLREKEDEELRMIEKMERDRQERERQEIEKIQEEMEQLKQQLREREQIEKWFKDRTEKNQIEKERQNIQLIQKRKEEIHEQIAKNESNIQRLKDRAELMRLEQEKQELDQKWKQQDIMKEEERKRAEAQAKIEAQKRLEQERINKMELDRLNQETLRLKEHLQSKLTEEKWLAKRVGEEEYVKTVMKGVRQQKRQQYHHEREKARLQQEFKQGRVVGGSACATCADDDDVSTDSSTIDEFKQMASQVPQPMEPVIQDILTEQNPTEAVFNTLEKDIRQRISEVKDDKDAEDYTLMMKSLKQIQEMYSSKIIKNNTQNVGTSGLSLPTPKMMPDPNFTEPIQTGGPPNTVDACGLETTMDNLDQILQMGE